MTDEDVASGYWRATPRSSRARPRRTRWAGCATPSATSACWLDNVGDRDFHAATSAPCCSGWAARRRSARLYARARRAEQPLDVLDTSNPDTIAVDGLHGATIIASSKSGTTIETQTLLAHALDNGLEPQTWW